MSQKPVTREDLLEFKEQLIEELQTLTKGRVTDQKLWLRSNEVKKLLRISTTTLQTLRSNGTLRCSKVGGTLYFNYRDIVKLMEDSILTD